MPRILFEERASVRGPLKYSVITAVPVEVVSKLKPTRAGPNHAVLDFLNVTFYKKQTKKRSVHVKRKLAAILQSADKTLA
jgi:hypothetical protein